MGFQSNEKMSTDPAKRKNQLQKIASEVIGSKEPGGDDGDDDDVKGAELQHVRIEKADNGYVMHSEHKKVRPPSKDHGDAGISHDYISKRHVFGGHEKQALLDKIGKTLG